MFSAEIGYIDFGKASGGPIDIEVDSFYGAAVGRIAFNNDLTGVGRIGIANVDTKITFLGSESEMKLYYGLGLEYSFNKNLKGVAALDFTEGEHSGDSGDVHLISLGIQYSF